jgi:hypothetical protein
MKFTVTFKDPQALDAAWEEEVSSMQEVPEDAAEPWMADQWEQEFREFLSQWVRYGEYVTIEFDTETGTATVKTVK